MTFIKNIGKLVAIGLVGLNCLMPQNIRAGEVQEKPIVNLSIDNSLYNKYIFWGLKFGDNPVWQSIVNLNKNYLTGTLFGNVDIEKKEVNEVDAFVDFTYPLNDKVNVSLGGGYYNFKIGEKWLKDQEIYSGIKMSVLLNPSLVFHRLFDLGKGNYVEASVFEDLNISGNPVHISGKLGYDTSGYREGDGFSHVETGVSVPVQLTDKLRITPNINFSKSLASDLKDEFYGGINVHYDF